MASESARLELQATSRIAPLLVATDRCIARTSFCAAVITRWRQAGNIAARESPRICRKDVTKIPQWEINYSLVIPETCNSSIRTETALGCPIECTHHSCAKAAGRAGG